MGILATMFDISWFFNGLEQFKYTVTKNAAFKLIGVALLFAFVHSKDDLLKYVFILTLSTMAGNLSMWMYVGRFTEKVDFRSLRIGRHFRETLIYFVPSIATSVYTVLDKTLIVISASNWNEINKTSDIISDLKHISGLQTRICQYWQCSRTELSAENLLGNNLADSSHIASSDVRIFLKLNDSIISAIKNLNRLTVLRIRSNLFASSD